MYINITVALGYSSTLITDSKVTVRSSGESGHVFDITTWQQNGPLDMHVSDGVCTTLALLRCCTARRTTHA
jgi:hypothetical protein